MRNVLSVDVEEYFQVEAFANQVPRDSWDSFNPRVERNVHRILDLFAHYDVHASFFVLGWIAERYPTLVREIALCGHEIACHGFFHQHLHRLTPEEFRQDVRRARNCLMDESQQPVCAYRAPSFSIVKSTFWALDILAEEGFTIDSSIFPVRHDNYGIPDAPRFPHWLHTQQGNSIFEFPPSTLRLWHVNVGAAGGGYLRLAPYSFTRAAIRRLNLKERQPAVTYFHPWEIDPDQPRIPAPLRSRLRHYSNLASMETKLGRLIQEFRFASLLDVCNELECYRAGLACVGSGKRQEANADIKERTGELEEYAELPN